MLWLRDFGGGPRRRGQRDPGGHVRHHRQKQAEAVAGGENRYRDRRAGPGGAYVWDAGNEGTASAAISPQIQRLLGYTPEEWSTTEPVGRSAASRTSRGCSPVGTPRWPTRAFTAEYRSGRRPASCSGSGTRPSPSRTERRAPRLPGRDVRHHRATRHEQARRGGGALPTLWRTPRRHLHRRGRDRRARPVAPVAPDRAPDQTTPEATADAGFWDVDPPRGPASASSRACGDTGTRSTRVPADPSRQGRHLGTTRPWWSSTRTRPPSARSVGVIRSQGRRTGRRPGRGRYRNLVETAGGGLHRRSTAPPPLREPSVRGLTGYSPAHRPPRPTVGEDAPRGPGTGLAESDRRTIR